MQQAHSKQLKAKATKTGKAEVDRKQPLSFYHFNIIHSLSVASVTFLTLFGDVSAAMNTETIVSVHSFVKTHNMYTL